VPFKKLSDLQLRAKMGTLNHPVLGACFLLLLFPRSLSRLKVPYIFAVKFIKQVLTLPPTWLQWEKVTFLNGNMGCKLRECHHCYCSWTHDLP